MDSLDSHNPFPTKKFLDSSKPNEFADNNLKLDEMAEYSPKRVENSEGKGEIARYEQFLILPSLHCRQVKSIACLGK